MTRRVKQVLLAAFVLSLIAGVPAAAQARVAPTVSKPKLSATRVVGVPFTVSGVVRPKATAASRTVVKIRLYTRRGGQWRVTGTYRAKLAKSAIGTKYSRQLTVSAQGSYAVRALHYRARRLVATSALTPFALAQRIDIDSMVNGWMEPADTLASAGKPLDIVFSTPSDWVSRGLAHFIWGDFEKVGASGLIWHTDGLSPGRYDWMRNAPDWGNGSLVVAQRIDIDSMSHEDSHALAYLPADISFGRVTGCDSSIEFLTGVFAKTSADPLVWHTDGLVPGSYDWKCYMDDCCFGKLVVDDAPDVRIPASPRDAQTSVAPGSPMDLVFSAAGGMEMPCWRTIHFKTAGSGLTKTTSYSAADPHVTWHTDGLATGSYEWQCWMGPQCHHGTIVVQ